MELNKVVSFLRRFAPIEIAESWDNVGLLLEPTACIVEKVLLTNDLTEPVVDEALLSKTNLIVSYHPPIFTPLKRISQDNWKSRILTRCLENRIAVYSPHTSWDHIRGGVNDWLAKAFIDHPFQVEFIEELKNYPSNLPEAGIGRKLTLLSPITIEDAIRLIKKYLKLDHVRVAKPFIEDKKIHKIGVCAGAGSSVLRLAPPGTFDLVLTGEMSHHDALDFTHNGTCVVLCEHSNTERGFLYDFQSIMQGTLNLLTLVSTADRDPLVIK